VLSLLEVRMSIGDDARAATARLLGGFRVTQLLHVAAELDIARHLAGGPMAVDDVARAVGAQPDALYRVLRALASHGVFVETAPKVFASTPMGDALRGDAPDSLRPIAVSYGQAWWWNSFGRLLDAVRTGQVAFDLLHGEALFPFLSHEAGAAAVFNANMSAMTQATAAAIAGAYPFDQVRAFMDVGGGSGVLGAALLERWPHLRGTLLDQASAIDAARGRGLASGRCDLLQGDFFAAVPAGADLYILKDILHDWDDVRATAILRNCRAAMAGDSKLLVIERLMPQGNEPAAVKDIDITMLVMTGGRERTLDDYERLLGQAELALSRVVPTGLDSVILETVHRAA
jgi:hypothetical protein